MYIQCLFCAFDKVVAEALEIRKSDDLQLQHIHDESGHSIPTQFFQLPQNPFLLVDMLL